MKIVSQIKLVFATILVVFAGTTYLTIERSNLAKTELGRVIKHSQILDQSAMTLRNQAQALKSSLLEVLATQEASKINALGDEVFARNHQLNTSFTDMLSHLTPIERESIDNKHTFELHQLLENIIALQRQKVELVRQTQHDWQEMNNRIVASDIAIKKALNLVGDDEFLRKDVESYFEMRNAAASLVSRVMFATDLDEANKSGVVLRNLEQGIVDEEQFLLDELVPLQSDRDYKDNRTLLLDYLFGEHSVAVLRIELLATQLELEQATQDFNQYEVSLDALNQQLIHIVERNNHKVENDLSTVFHTIQKTQLTVLIGGILLLGFVAWYLTSQIKRPIRYLTQVFQNLVEGDYTQSIQTKGWSYEFNQLSRQLEQVIEANCLLIEQVKTNNLSIIAQTVENDQAVAEVNLLGDKQVAAMDEISTAVEELEQISDETERSIRQSQGHTEQVRSLVQSSIEVVDRNVSGNDALSGMIEQSVATIKTVEHRSQDISQIISVIEDIANQTNLLALNAAIEAARAGEQGRGFAVVSEEVAELAKRTTSATHRIQNLIDNLQSASQEAVSEMALCADKMSENSQQIQNAKSAIGQIEENMNHLTHESEVISQSASEQHQSCTHIATSVNSSVERMHLATEALNQVTARSQTLNQLVEGQQKALTKFTT
ncbi:methyl-accepting chemotaxis protein [Vibrio sp. SCSIO 43136]|uniref:methyl-accepting chemotaxis protein n=1 Tax=Vibrio sp. SCSIO 43136 TaxID=2819101 RepID=UPI002074BB55|nr:methyl-accepting chemotaxis protein [Vibrio sp. SCSIO 43136]USD67394.1 methyl-accepting chemotaxis protein [Vibrio sp. SCSIO 43136]